MFARYAELAPVAEPTHIRSTWLAGFKSVPVAGTVRGAPAGVR